MLYDKKYGVNPVAEKAARKKQKSRAQMLTKLTPAYKISESKNKVMTGRNFFSFKSANFTSLSKKNRRLLRFYICSFEIDVSMTKRSYFPFVSYSQ